LNSLVERLKEKFVIKKVYLYGSMARDEMHEGSDIDLVIVGDFVGKMFDRIEKVLQCTDLPVEPLVYTEEQFDRMKRENTFLKEALASAIVLYPRSSSNVMTPEQRNPVSPAKK